LADLVACGVRLAQAMRQPEPDRARAATFFEEILLQEDGRELWADFQDGLMTETELRDGTMARFATWLSEANGLTRRPDTWSTPELERCFEMALLGRPAKPDPPTREDEHLKRFGLSPRLDDLPAIREILREEARLEHARQGAGDTDVMKLCCVQLFCAGQISDALEIWRASTVSMDAHAAIDIQTMCGAGLLPTKRYLADLKTEEAAAALSELSENEEFGLFEEFSVDDYLEAWREYYA
jgi:hypothetical protein